MRAKVTEVGPPITLIVSDFDLSLAVVPYLTPDVLGEDQVCALSIIQLLLRCLLVMETSLDYGH